MKTTTKKKTKKKEEEEEEEEERKKGRKEENRRKNSCGFCMLLKLDCLLGGGRSVDGPRSVSASTRVEQNGGREEEGRTNGYAVLVLLID